MKNLILKNAAWGLMALTASVLSFSSCSSDESNVVSTETVPLQVNAGIAKLTSRVGEADLSNTGTTFDKGSTIDVFYSEEPDAGVYTWDGSIWTGSPTLGIKSSSQTGYTIYGVYPSTGSKRVFDDTFTFTVENEQKTADNYKNSDLMVAQGTASYSNANVNLNFKHVMARLEVEVVDEDSSPCSVNVFTTWCNLKYEGNPFAENELATAGTDQISLGYGDTFYILIPPQKYPKDKQIFSFTLGTTMNPYKILADEELSFESGCSYKLTITLSSSANNATISNVTIKGWEDKAGGKLRNELNLEWE